MAQPGRSQNLSIDGRLVYFWTGIPPSLTRMGNRAKGRARDERSRVEYVRVSSLDSNAARQLDGVALDWTFVDQASEKDAQRPQLEDIRALVSDGDTVAAHSMDRLARNQDDLRRLVQEFTGHGCASSS